MVINKLFRKPKKKSNTLLLRDLALGIYVPTYFNLGS